ncbi:MAG: hypothetical protein BroJett011_42590 [Chloroflexota bacterium]|nr:MAG: hypothetical protein BroJett011_42590 [Chloroflexota bacterium]
MPEVKSERKDGDKQQGNHRILTGLYAYPYGRLRLYRLQKSGAACFLTQLRESNRLWVWLNKETRRFIERRGIEVEASTT